MYRYKQGDTMAGKAKSVYLTVTTLDHKSVFHRMFFNAKEFNDFVKTEEFKAKYPTTEFKIIKEVY
jgi:hypothetical protein